MNPHKLLPTGVSLSVEDCNRAGVEFYHLSRERLEVGFTMRSEDYQRRPHYELFRHPPSPEFLSIPRFSSDRLLEATFEKVRKTIAIAAPSREYAIFTFLCEQCATWFRENSDAARKEATIVKLDIRPGSKIYVTDLVWRNIAAQVLLKDRWREPDFPFPSSRQLDGLRRVAEAYWQGRDPDAYGLGTIPEALIDGETVVLTDLGCKN